MKVTKEFKIRHLFAWVIIALLFLKVFGTSIYPLDFEKSTTEETIVTKKKDSVVRTTDSLRPVEKIIFYDTITHVITRYREIPKKHEVQKKLLETKDTIQLHNGTVFSSILSEGKVFEHKLSLITQDTLIKKETIIKKVVTPSVWFLNVAPTFNLKSELTGIDITTDYTFKNRLRIGAGIGYNNALPKDKIQLKLNIGIPLN